MRDDRKELLRRFYLTLELMCSDADRAAGRWNKQRLGDLYDDADETSSLWEKGSPRPFLFAYQS
jgi:hypothetical protein